MVRVIVDEREKRSGVPEGLQRLGATVDYRVLEIADYLIGNMAVERKSARDFLSSLYSGRLFDQAFRMSEAYETTILVVEGNLESSLKRLKNPRSLWGALISAVLDFRLNLFFTPDPGQTAEFLLALGKGGRHYGGSTGPPLIVRKPKGEDVRRVQLSIVSSIPGIGPRIAEQLLTVLGSVRKVFTASSTDMAVGVGIGRERALRVNKILDTPYKGSKKVAAQSLLRQE